MARDLYVDLASPGPVRDGSSWASAYTDLQLALAAATYGDRILIAGGVYKPTATTDRTISFALKDGVSLLGGYAGRSAYNPNARDVASYPTICSGDIGISGDNTDNSYHVVTGGAGTTSATILDGITVTQGNANDGTFPGNAGGGMYLESASPTLINCTFRQNSASSEGGAMYNHSSSPTLTNCTFDGNSSGEEGGAIANIWYASPTLTNCTFIANSAAYGGGISNTWYSAPVLANCTFSANAASYFGGAIRNRLSASPALTNCTFTGNTAGLEGGGMDNFSSSAPTLTGCVFTRNSASLMGGGMYNSSSSPILVNCVFSGNTVDRSSGEGGGMYNNASSPTLRNCIFTGNMALNGGGIANRNSSSPSLTNCIFSGNLASVGGGGGGMHNYQSSSPVLTNCTFSGNSVGSYALGYGGAIQNYNASSPTLTNCSIWGSGSVPVDNHSSTPVITYSDIQYGYAGAGNINADPRFIRSSSPGPDGTWGTADDDYGNLRLQPTSPAINAGNNAAPGLSGVTMDLTGGPRITGGIVDMGAYELDTSAPTITSVAINDGVAQRSMVKKLAMVFSEPVSLSTGALTVKFSTGAAVPNTTATMTNPSGDGKTYVLTFSGSAVIGGSLPDGIYDLIVTASGVQDLAGNPLTANYTQRFHRLFGDSDGNKVVNALDYAQLKNTLGRLPSDPLFNSTFDYEGSNLINALDLARFRQRYGLSFSY